jgi:hypothetical protein
VVVTIVGTEEIASQTFDKLKALIKGRQVSLDELPSLASLDIIKKVHSTKKATKKC